jgi:hypothetical protein
MAAALNNIFSQPGFDPWPPSHEFNTLWRI